MGFLLKEALKSLCGVNQWSYAVFWKIGCQNPKLLTGEDCYYEPASYSEFPGNEDISTVSSETRKLQSCIQAGDKVQWLVNKMILDIHVNVVGEGLVGKVAFTGNHQWILSDNYFVEAHPTEVLKEVLEQFSAGMQTIAVIPVLPHGVVQFGSQKKIIEDVGFVDYVTSFLLNLGNVSGALPSENKKAKELVSEIWVPTYLGKACNRSSSTMSCDIVRCEEPKIFTGTGNQGKFSNPNMSAGALMSAQRTSCGLIYSFDNDSVTLPSAEINGVCKGMMSSCAKPVPSKDFVLDAKRAAFENITSKHSNPSEHNNVVLSQVEDYTSVCASVSYTSIPYGQFRASKKDSGANSRDSSIYESQRSSCIEMGENRKRANNVSADIPKKLDETGKTSRKRSKPGENPRARPKDRKMMEDRVKELRKIVPNGGKCSIEVLLEYTIKHMLFLQSVTKHPGKLKQTGEAKNINKDGGLLLKDDSGGGATWAYEVGSQSMIYPLIVEDLNSHRQMLVKMLCEERGLFLEIADIIRGLRLTILKGVMETRKDKIWACFAIEANSDVTRMEVFLSLFRLLDPTAQSNDSQPNVKHDDPTT